MESSLTGQEVLPLMRTEMGELLRIRWMKKRHVAAWNAYASVWDLPPSSTTRSHMVALVLGI